MKKNILYSLIILLGVSSLTYAGNCFTGACFVPQKQFIVHKNVVDRVDVLQKRVVFDEQYYAGLDGYYAVKDQLVEQDEQLNRKVLLKQSEQLEKLLELLIIEKKADLRDRGLINGQNPQEPAPNNPPNVPNPPDVPSNPTPSPQPGDNDWGDDTDDLNVKVFGIFQNKCATCHTDDPNRMVLVGNDNGEEWLNNLSLEERVLVYDHTYGVGLQERGKKLMPLGGPALDDEDVNTLRLWMYTQAEADIKSRADSLSE